ncbi:hypothetical protein OAH34_02980, partial [bacterium]|nr:hypothetical protein [bacterium]
MNISLRNRPNQLLAFAVISLISVDLAPDLFAQKPGGGKVKVLVGFAQPPGQAEVNLIANNGGQVTRRFRIIDSLAAELPQAAVNALANHPSVRII